MNDNIYIYPYFQIDLSSPGVIFIKLTLKGDHDFDDLKSTINDHIRNEYIYNMYNTLSSIDLISKDISDIINTYIEENGIVANPITTYTNDGWLFANTIKPKQPDDGLTFNERMYRRLLDDFKITNQHDRKYLANKFAKLYKKYDCIDNHRICYSDESKSTTELYDYLCNKGCCGEYNEHILNEVTGNYFYIGFNYGH